MKVLAFDDLSGHSISMTNEDASYPATNMLTEYINQLSKSTTRSSTITINSGTCRDISILNTNAESGTITVTGYASRSSGQTTIVNAQAMAFSNRCYYLDLGATYYGVAISISGITAIDESETISDTRTYFAEDTLTINGDWTLETGADVTVAGNLTINGSITINAGTLTVTGTITINASSPLLEVGGIFTGVMNSYGSSDTAQVSARDYDVKFSQNGDQYQYNGFGTMNDYQALSKYLLQYADRRFIVIPDRSGRSGVKISDFVGFGKATLQNTSNNSHIQEKWSLTIMEKA